MTIRTGNNLEVPDKVEDTSTLRKTVLDKQAKLKVVSEDTFSENPLPVIAAHLAPSRRRYCVCMTMTDLDWQSAEALIRAYLWRSYAVQVR